MGSPKYRNDEVDADGNEYIDDSGVTDGFYYDATKDTWHTPTTPGFYGAGRDGYYYWNGTQCAVGGLGTSTAFGSWNDSVLIPYSVPWDEYAGGGSPGGTTTINGDNSVSFSIVDGDGPVWLAFETAGEVYSMRRWCFTGSGAVDVQIDYSDFLCEDAFRRSAKLFLEFYYDLNNYVRVIKYRDPNQSQERYRIERRANGGVVGWTGTGDIADITAGRMRLTKAQNADPTKSDFDAYWWDGAWQSVGTYAAEGFGLAWSKPIYIRVALQVTALQEVGGCDASATVYDFTINDGATSTRPGWALESSGTERGLRADFPERSVTTTTDTSVSIIDIDHHKLWMRFLQGVTPSDNLLGDRYYDESGGSPKPRRVYMKNGVLTIAQGETDAAQNNGGHLVVDFNLDYARVYRAASSSFEGAVYGDTSNLRHVVDRPGGAIATRNDDEGWRFTNTSWRVPDNRLQATSQWRSGDYDYRASATYLGLSIQKNEVYRIGNDTNADWAAASIDTWYEACAFDQANGDLYYLDSSNVYYAAQATWDAAMGGSDWVADSVVARPGTLSVNGQDCIAIADGDIYLIANEGVYKATTGGAYTLEYGKSGSGATYEVMSSYDRVSAIAAISSGTDWGLVCNISVDSPTSYNLELIDLTLNDVTKTMDITSYMNSEPLRVSG